LSAKARTSFSVLAQELERRFDAGVRRPWPDNDFNALALETFALQFEAIPAYRGFCERHGRTPADVKEWFEVPAVPASAFKHLDLVSEASTPPEAVFRTSGTTRGEGERGRHPVPRLSLYRHALLPPFRTHVLAARGRIRFVSLIPSPAERPDSSLSYMVGAAAEVLGNGVHWVVDGDGTLQESELRGLMRRSSHAREPVLLLGTALALLHALEGFEAEGVAPLAPGSRVMETGGFKGAGREITRVELYGRLSRATGVPAERIVSEYGMTELLSQLYEPVLSEGPGAAGTHVAPPWLRVRALDPATLDEVQAGEEGLLAFFDLANVGSVCHVLTEDVGSVVRGRVRLTGRAAGAEPRGCSLAMDELMSASRAAGDRASRSAT
jgi:Acyl-protein synthetase, LuxE